MEKAVIYARYSSDKQTEQSIDGQLRECKNFAESKGYTIIGEYIDRALTGRVDKRPDFQRMIKDSHKKLFQYVIVYQLDRFARSKYDSAHYKHLLKKNNVKVLSAKENINDDPSGILMETMLEGMAEYYSAELSVKVTRGMYEGFLKGHTSGSGCFGYDLVPVAPNNKANTAKIFVVNENEAVIVRKIYADYASGKTIVQIKEWLDEKRITTRRNQPIHGNTIMHILKNTKYIGTLTFAKESRENAIPAIVDKEIFAQVQARIIKNTRNKSAFKAVERYLLTHKLYCGYCKKTIIADSGKKPNGNIYRYYKCHTKKSQGKDCAKCQVNKRWLEDLVINETMKLLTTQGMIEKIAQQVMVYSDQKRVDTNLEKYEKQLAEVQSKIKSIITAIEQGIILPSTKDRLIELEADKADLQWRIDGERMNTPIKLVYDEVVYWFVQFTQGDVNDEQFRERIIDTFINKIILWNDRIIITYNIKGRDSEKVTIDEIIKDFENEKTNPEEFDLQQYGTPYGNRTRHFTVKG